MIFDYSFNVYIASCDTKGGIYHYTLNKNGDMKFIEKTDLDRPMYLAIYKNTLFALLRSPFYNSNESGLISFKLSEDGELTNNSEIQSTKGEIACHLSVNNAVYCVNYISGSVIKMPDKLITHSGKSIHPARQTCAHPHNVILTPDNKYVCVTDLGLDKIFIYDKDLNLVSNSSVPQGHGARHMVFSPDEKYAFCSNEIKSTVTPLYYCDGKLTVKDTYSTLPAGFQGENTAAAIRISSDGKYLYVSNRGHDSISCFKVKGGRLDLFETVNCGGKSPRDFNISPDGEFLICTNESSDNITAFRINNGRLFKINSEIRLTKPLCVIYR